MISYSGEINQDPTTPGKLSRRAMGLKKQGIIIWRMHPHAAPKVLDMP